MLIQKANVGFNASEFHQYPDITHTSLVQHELCKPTWQYTEYSCQNRLSHDPSCDYWAQNRTATKTEKRLINDNYQLWLHEMMI